MERNLTHSALSNPNWRLAYTPGNRRAIGFKAPTNQALRCRCRRTGTQHRKRFGVGRSKSQDWKPQGQWGNLHDREPPELRGGHTPAEGGSGAMRIKFCAALMLGFFLSAGFFVHSIEARDSYQSGNPFIASDCDRACVYGFVDQYLAALVAKDPARVPWAKNVKFTENNVVLQIGDGLWGTISGRGTEDLRAADPANGQVAYYGVV